jgi:hypothetical protein
LRRAVKWAAVAVLVAFVGVQFRPVDRTNPPVDPDQTLERHLAVPAEVKAILDRSCRDCHTSQTRWPFYAYIAPVSWDIVGHVNQGRQEMNFSEWGRYDADAEQDLLIAICRQVRAGDMPLPSYARIHRSARLSADEIRRLCVWSAETRKALRAAE